MKARRHGVLTAILAAALLGIAGAAPAGGATPVTFNIDLRWTGIWLHGADTTTYTVSLLDGTRVLRHQAVTTDAQGNGLANLGERPVPGLRLRAQTSGYTRTWTVPALGLVNDRVTDVVSGAAPAGLAVTVSVDRLATGTYGAGPAGYLRQVTATGAGAYSVDLTADGGFRGGDTLAVVVMTPAGDRVNVQTVAEYVRVERASDFVFGRLNAGAPAELVLQSGGGWIRGRAYVTAYAADYLSVGRFVTGKGAAVYPRVGDKVVGDLAGDAIIPIPDISITAVAATDVVTLTCPGMPGQGASISVRKSDASVSASRVGVANASGVRTFDVTTSIDLEVGDILEGTCRLDSGDEIGVSGTVGS